MLDEAKRYFKIDEKFNSSVMLLNFDIQKMLN